MHLDRQSCSKENAIRIAAATRCNDLIFLPLTASYHEPGAEDGETDHTVA
jgi:hypothetical protein